AQADRDLARPARDSEHAGLSFELEHLEDGAHGNDGEVSGQGEAIAEVETRDGLRDLAEHVGREPLREHGPKVRSVWTRVRVEERRCEHGSDPRGNLGGRPRLAETLCGRTRLDLDLRGGLRVRHGAGLPALHAPERVLDDRNERLRVERLAYRVDGTRLMDE